jgi:hypothetical protein
MLGEGGSVDELHDEVDLAGAVARRDRAGVVERHEVRVAQGREDANLG